MLTKSMNIFGEEKRTCGRTGGHKNLIVCSNIQEHVFEGGECACGRTGYTGGH